MLADQYREFMEATTGAVLPTITHAPRHSELRRSTAASATKVQQMDAPNIPNGSSRQRAMLEALAGMNEQSADAEAAAALQTCSAAVLTAMPQLQVSSISWARGGPLLQDAVRLGGGENLILQRVLAASSAPTFESAHALSLRSAVTTGRTYLDATLPPMPCW
ncbi:unnamed protein product [Symbiodinium pilosum]|uniref:Uncharacterized protein n=1 Tax=Symbiodinium pilosum TaxID=2952 RepID=A0A812WJ00_SYMPI|nr:unnamed protein product [Symbiodinium pilosum]